MNTELVRKLGELLGSAYPKWLANEGTGLVFWRVLEGLDEDAILAAAWSWVRENTWPPSPADIRKLAERFDKYLRQGPSVQVVHLRWQGFDYALDESALRSLSGLPELRQAIYEQTTSPVEAHLERWRLEQIKHEAHRRALVHRRANGDWSDGETHELLGPGTTTGIIPQEPT